MMLFWCPMVAMNSADVCKKLFMGSWNTRGLNDSDKCTDIKRNLSAQPLNVICLQETKFTNVSCEKASSFLPLGFWCFSAKSSIGASGGLVTAWRDDAVRHVRDLELRFTLTSFFEFAADGSQFAVSNIYVPCNAALQIDFLDELRLGPDGFGPAFFKVFWLVVKEDLLAFLDEFHHGDAHLARLNQAFIALLPKTNELVAFEQSGFIAGHCIMDNFLYAVELVQCCRLRGTPTIALKLDFKKAFDSVNWSSLDAILEARGFGALFRSWFALLKAALDTFSAAMGLTINYHKSTFVPICVPAEEASSLAAMLGCAVSSFPQTYLGLPLSNHKLLASALEFLAEKIVGRIPS
ncbi:hypothetical protein ACQ4PT_048236 [Festuca glaucescens]